MAQQRPRYAGSRPPRFYLDQSPSRGRARLAADEAHHALHVLRCDPGTVILGLDGRGRSWLCEIESVEKQHVELCVREELEREVQPGLSGARRPELVLCAALPRGKKAEEMIERAIPLGLTRLVPLQCAKGQSAGAGLSQERFARLARAACKQAELAWLPELMPPAPLERAPVPSGASLLLLAPGAPEALASTVRGACRAGARSFALFVGPEAGFTHEEHALLLARGARELALGPGILRIEHAAESALAIVMHACFEENCRGPEGAAGACATPPPRRDP